jgi:hypothetical protein
MKRSVPLLALLLLAHVVFAETQTDSGSEAPAACVWRIPILSHNFV